MARKCLVREALKTWRNKCDIVDEIKEEVTEETGKRQRERQGERESKHWRAERPEVGQGQQKSGSEVSC